MPPAVIIILVVVGVAGLVFLIVKAAKAAAERERRRLEALSRWAALNGFAFHPRDPWNLDARFRNVADIGRGHDRYALEVLSCQDPVPAFLFRYHYKTWETRTVRDSKGRTRTQRYEQTHWRRFLILELGGQFPHLAIRPEGVFDRIAGFVGFDDIDFESEAFSKRFHVKSADKQFAYAVVHPQVMEWMLAPGPAQTFAAELNGPLFIMAPGSDHSTEGCQTVWTLAAGFVNRIPPFVWQDYGRAAGPVALPDARPYVPPPPVPEGQAAETAAGLKSEI